MVLILWYKISSNYDKELSLTGERGITKPAPKNPQVRRLIMEEYSRNEQEEILQRETSENYWFAFVLIRFRVSDIPKSLPDIP